MRVAAWTSARSLLVVSFTTAVLAGSAPAFANIGPQSDVARGRQGRGVVGRPMGVVTEADLSITKNDGLGGGNATANIPFTYTIVVINNGPDAALNVVVADTLPVNGGATYGTPTTTQGTCSVSVNILTCSIGTMVSPPSFVTITISVTASIDGVILDNTAQVSSLTPDPNTGNNTARTSTAVGANTSTATPTITPTSTPTSTRTNTPTNTATNTPINTPTNTPTGTPAPSNTPTNTPANTSTNTPTNTTTNSPTGTATSTATNTPANTPTNTPTNTTTSSPTGTATSTSTNTPANTPTNTPTGTPTTSNTPTNTPSNTPTNTATNTPTNTPTPVFTASPSPGIFPNSAAVPTLSESGMLALGLLLAGIGYLLLRKISGV